LQKIDILDLSLIKLLQTNKGAILCLIVYSAISCSHNTKI